MNWQNRPGVSVRVILPDPTDRTLVDQLSQRYSMPNENMKTKIEEAEEDFRSKFNNPHGANLTILYTKVAPVFDIYKFDDAAVITLFSHRKGKTTVPTLLVKKDGTLYKFVEDELRAFVEGENPLARPIPST